MQIERIEEFKIKPITHQAIQELLYTCFAEYPARSFFKQLPNFRYLAWDKNILIGHLAVEHRIINNGEQLLHIFGVSDLCVLQAYQEKSVASSLLDQLSTLGKEHNIDFLLLIADTHGLYLKNKFKLVDNTCRWLMINSNQTLGVNHRKIERSLMIKRLGTKKWHPGLVDFLGHIF